MRRALILASMMIPTPVALGQVRYEWGGVQYPSGYQQKRARRSLPAVKVRSLSGVTEGPIRVVVRSRSRSRAGVGRTARSTPPRTPRSRFDIYGSSGRSRIYPAGRSRIYPTGRSRIYPTGRSRIYPTGRSRIYPTRRSRIYPTGRSRIYPARRSRIYPAGR